MAQHDWWNRTSAADDGSLDDDDNVVIVDQDEDDEDWLDDFDFGSYAEPRGSFVGNIWGRYAPTVNRADSAARLASAQRLCQGIVDTFATDDLPYVVTFDESVGTAGTDFKSRKVVISHKPLFDSTLTDDEANVILTAMAVHESDHVAFGKNTAEAARKEWGQTGRRGYNPTAMRISNFLDDVRIERRDVERYPGHEGIFEPALDYVATSALREHGMDALDPARVPSIELAVAATRYPMYVAWTPETETERDWWADWSARGTRDDRPSTHIAAIEEALAHLKDMPEPEPEPQDGEGKQGEGDGQGEQGQSSGSESGSEQKQGGQVGGSILPDCFADAAAETAESHGLDSDVTSAEAQELVEQGKALTEPLDADGKRGEVYWGPGGISRGKAQVRSSGTAAAAIRAAFARSRTGHYAVERSHKSGRLDNRSLTRIAAQDYRLFNRRSARSEGRYLVWLMVDCSGSMDGLPIRDAASVAAALAQASRYLPNIRLDIWGWTSGWRLGGVFGAVRCWKTGDPIANVGYLPNVRQGGTPDKWTLKWAAQAIRKAALPGETPVILMASDGHGYFEANDPVIAEAREAGVKVISVAIGDAIRPDYQARLYGEKGYVAWAGSIVRTAGPLGKLLARIATGQQS